MEACARKGKSMIVLDRVNPLGGVKRCGTIIKPEFASFVGDYALATQYGLTMGEFAGYVKDYLKLDVDLTVVELEGWTRDTLLDETDLPVGDIIIAVGYENTSFFHNQFRERYNCSPFRWRKNKQQ